MPSKDSKKKPKKDKGKPVSSANQPRQQDQQAPSKDGKKRG